MVQDSGLKNKGKGLRARSSEFRIEDLGGVVWQPNRAHAHSECSSQLTTSMR
jgi:hypothetical protein